MTIRKVGGYGASLGANTFTGVQTFSVPLVIPDSASAAAVSIGRVGQPGTGYGVGNNSVGVATGGVYRLVVDTGTFAISLPTTATSYQSGAPSGGTAGVWKLGVAAVVSPTSPNRTIELDVGGTIYYLAAKTTNN